MADVKTRNLNNENDPICYPDGSLYVNSEVVFQLLTAKSKKATSVFDAVSAEMILGDEVVVLTDSRGIFSVDLWPNSRGEFATVYRVSIGSAKSFIISIPDGDDPLSMIEARAAILGDPQDLTAFETLMASIDAKLANLTQPATQTTTGLMFYSDKLKLDSIVPATVNPLMNGVATIGNSGAYARQDHVHPTDTSRASAAQGAKADTAVQPQAIGVTIQPFNAGTVTAITDSTGSTSSTTAASAKAVKTAYDLANSKLSDAPNDGTQYARKNGAWQAISFASLSAQDQATLDTAAAVTAAPAITQSAYTKVLTLPAGETSAERIAYCGGDKFVCGTEGTAKIYTSSDAGATWTDRARIGGTTTELSIYGLISLGGGVVLAGTSPNGKLWRSTNYGVSFTQVTTGYTDAGANHDLRGFADMGGGVVLLGNANLSAGGQSGKIWRSTDSGASWAQTYTGSLTADLYYVTSMCNVGNSTALAVLSSGGMGPSTTSKILRSTDNGLTWAVVKTINATSIMTICSNGAGTALVAACVGGNDGGKIFRTTDYGATWTDLGVGVPGIAIYNGLTFLGGTSYLVGTNGSGTASCSVWQSDDAGSTWRLIQQLDDGTSDITVYTFAYNESKAIICGTYKPGSVGKIWRSTSTMTSWPSAGGRNLIGTGAPVTTPAFFGQEYIDTSAVPKKFYKAAGTTSVADWIALN